MAEKLTWDEIRARYPDEYVVLIETEWDGSLPEVRTGVVLGHSKRNKELLARLKAAIAGQSVAILFTGEVGSGNYLFLFSSRSARGGPG